MTGRQYNTQHYKKTKASLRPEVEAGLAHCAEIVCVMRTRWIPPGSPWALAHDHRDPTGLTLLGPAHRRCNLAESARRNNPKRAKRALTRWIL